MLTLDRIERFRGSEVKITLRRSFLWMDRGEVEYVGSSTVWRRYPDGKRAGILLESWLINLHQQWKWRQAQEEKPFSEPVGWVCEADLVVMNQRGGIDLSMSPTRRDDLGMRTPLYRR